MTQRLYLASAACPVVAVFACIVICATLTHCDCCESAVCWLWSLGLYCADNAQQVLWLTSCTWCIGQLSADGRYSYNIATNADERRENPTPAQQRINELLLEQRMQKQFEKQGRV